MKKVHLLLLLPVFCLFSMRSDKKNITGLKSVLDNMQYIPATSMSLQEDDGQSQDMVISVNGFFLSRYEVTNRMYLAYLNELQTTDTAAYRKALPDTNAWVDKATYMEPYQRYYLRHPAYADYPVVAVSYLQAKDYCAWLNRKIAATPNSKYPNARFDLPTKNEWVVAATAGHKFNNFPWEGNSMMSKEGKWLANFQPMDQSTARRDDDTTKHHAYTVYGGEYFIDGAFITARGGSYGANEFGLYDMAGNVEEMVREEGVSKGGSWKDSGYYLRNEVEENYSSGSSSTERGFRVAMYTSAGN